MRAIGSLHPTEGIPLPSDCVGVVIGTSALAVIAQDYPAAQATASTRPHIMLISSNVPVYFRDGSTAAAIPGTSTVGSSLNSAFISQSAFYQVPGGSTGYSLAFPTSGITTIEFFRKGGN